MFSYPLEDFRALVMEYYDDYHKKYDNIIPNDLQTLINAEIRKIKLNQDDFSYVLAALESGEHVIDLYYAKISAKASLDSFYNDLEDDEKALVKNIIDNAKDAIENSKSIDNINIIKEDAINQAIERILRDSKADLRKYLEDYHDDNYESEDVENVRDIIENKMAELSLSNYQTLLDELKEQGKIEIDLYYAKDGFINDLIDYYESKYNENISREALEIINDQVIWINIDNFDDLTSLIDQTKDLLEDYHDIKASKDSVENAIRDYHNKNFGDVFPAIIDDKILEIIKTIDGTEKIGELSKLINDGKDFIALYYNKQDTLDERWILITHLIKHQEKKLQA